MRAGIETPDKMKMNLQDCPQLVAMSHEGFCAVQRRSLSPSFNGCGQSWGINRNAT